MIYLHPIHHRPQPILHPKIPPILQHLMSHIYTLLPHLTIIHLIFNLPINTTLPILIICSTLIPAIICLIPTHAICLPCPRPTPPRTRPISPLCRMRVQVGRTRDNKEMLQEMSPQLICNTSVKENLMIWTKTQVYTQLLDHSFSLCPGPSLKVSIIFVLF